MRTAAQLHTHTRTHVYIYIYIYTRGVFENDHFNINGKKLIL